MHLLCYSGFVSYILLHGLIFLFFFTVDTIMDILGDHDHTQITRQFETSEEKKDMDKTITG